VPLRVRPGEPQSRASHAVEGRSLDRSSRRDQEKIERQRTTGRQDDLRRAILQVQSSEGKGIEEMTVENDRPIRLESAALGGPHASGPPSGL